MQDPNAYKFAELAIEDHPEIKRLPAMKQIAWAEAKVKEHFPEHFPAQRQSFSKVDGGGLGAFGKSTLLKKLNKGDYSAVPGEMAIAA